LSIVKADKVASGNRFWRLAVRLLVRRWCI